MIEVPFGVSDRPAKAGRIEHRGGKEDGKIHGLQQALNHFIIDIS